MSSPYSLHSLLSACIYIASEGLTPLMRLSDAKRHLKGTPLSARIDKGSDTILLNMSCASFEKGLYTEDSVLYLPVRTAGRECVIPFKSCNGICATVFPEECPTVMTFSFDIGEDEVGLSRLSTNGEKNEK